MARIRLTDAQSSPLFVLVDYQLSQRKDLVFVHSDGVVRSSVTVEGLPLKDPEKPGVAIPQIVFEVWRDRDLVATVESRGVSGTTIHDFTLTREALDFASRARKPRIARAVLDAMDDWRSDLRTAVLAMIFSILTNAVLNGLGLLR
jgi:hypothetical protein